MPRHHSSSKLRKPACAWMPCPVAASVHGDDPATRRAGSYSITAAPERNSRGQCGGETRGMMSLLSTLSSPHSTPDGNEARAHGKGGFYTSLLDHHENSGPRATGPIQANSSVSGPGLGSWFTFDVIMYNFHYILGGTCALCVPPALRLGCDIGATPCGWKD